MLRFQCLTISDSDTEPITMSVATALEYLEGFEGRWLVWKDSKAQKINGEFKQAIEDERRNYFKITELKTDLFV